MLWTLEQGLGPTWTPEAKVASTAADGLISGTTLRAASEVAPGVQTPAEALA